ncbi:MAG: dockerin type I domain-containing protein, partial [Pirellulales bacterium]|nr:dockerin type I domain-containing protein [Pirellulales bacterium]
VSPANDAPTLDSISNKTIDEDAPVQTVDLAGISAGAGESQPLRITATSSNTNLIADPIVSYTSPNPTGSLQFTPLANQQGVTTITVTLEDGGLDSDLATSDDNATTTTTFEVTVSGELKWHNYARPADVNNDRNISAVDALFIINHLNLHGSHLLPQSRPAGSMWLDVNRDGWVSPADAIFVINHLNGKNFDVAVSVLPLDLNGNQITTIEVGTSFYLSLVTEDLREDRKGVFAAYVDAIYPNSHLTVMGVASYLSPYVNGRSANTELAGIVDDWGAFAGLTETGSGSYIVSSIPMIAKSPGEIILSTSRANNSPSRDILLFGSEEAVDFRGIEFRASQLSILEEAEGEGWSIDDGLVSLLSSDTSPDLRSLDDYYGNY